MKVAVCFYGQSRSWKRCIERNLEMFKQIDADFFCSVKNYNTSIFSDEVEILDSAEIGELLFKIKPKKFFISHYEDEELIGNGSYSKLYQSIAISTLLKQEYEIENKMEYDYVIYFRYDAMLGPEIAWLSNFKPNPNTVHTSVKDYQFYGECNSYGLSDVFMIMDSITSNRVANSLYGYFYNTMNTVTRSDYIIKGAGVVLQQICNNANIKVESLAYDIGPAIIRADTPETDDFSVLKNHWVSGLKRNSQ